MLRSYEFDLARQSEPSGLSLLPWAAVAIGSGAPQDERMMWAQSGLSRLMSRLADLRIDLAASARKRRAERTPRARLSSSALRQTLRQMYFISM